MKSVKLFHLLFISIICFGFSQAGAAIEDATMPEAKVLIETSEGNIIIELFVDKAPISTTNFLQYVETEFFNDLIFHRVIPNFMIQGGGLTEDMTKKTTQAPIQNEANNGLRNDRGTIAMARTTKINSATSQFFINLKDNDNLNHAGPHSFGYAVFGKVTKGIDVVDRIAKKPTGTKNYMQNVPLQPIKILKVSIIDSIKAKPAAIKTNMEAQPESTQKK